MNNNVLYKFGKVFIIDVSFNVNNNHVSVINFVQLINYNRYKYIMLLSNTFLTMIY